MEIKLFFQGSFGGEDAVKCDGVCQSARLEDIQYGVLGKVNVYMANILDFKGGKGNEMCKLNECEIF